jgi:hypothetical protein
LKLSHYSHPLSLNSSITSRHGTLYSAHCMRVCLPASTQPWLPMSLPSLGQS